MASHSQLDVAIAGGGPIGLACAWRAAARGLRVAVVDPGRGEAGGEGRSPETEGAWHVAAGMLAPVSEAQFGDDALTALGLHSAARFPRFCAELAADSGEDPGLHAGGTLNVARDGDEAAALDRLHDYRVRLGLDVERLRPSQARRLEPALAPTVRLALHVPSDHSVDPRRMVAALRAALDRAGVPVLRGRVTGVRCDGDRVTGLVLDGDDTARAAGLAAADGSPVIPARQVLIATGAAAGTLAGLPDSAGVPVRPVKGQVLRLRDPRGAGLVERTIRGPDVYLVPRADGSYVLGGTMEDRGFDRTPTAGAVYELLRDMSEVVPGVLELDVEDLLAGLRPATPDNLPAIGPGALDGLHWATGHFRNGVLLTAVTADLAAAALSGEPLPDWAAPCDPRRFARVEALT